MPWYKHSGPRGHSSGLSPNAPTSRVFGLIPADPIHSSRTVRRSRCILQYVDGPLLGSIATDPVVPTPHVSQDPNIISFTQPDPIRLHPADQQLR
jgi:hypothetical protein